MKTKQFTKSKFEYPIIMTDNLSKEYQQGGKPLKVLRSVNLTVSNGEFIAIMGPSGSGKSTLLNLIGALDKPSSGKVYFKGLDISTFNDNQLAELRNREVGFVFQFFNLIPRIDSLGNVELPLSIAGVPIKERRRKASELLSIVGLGERIHHKPNQLSGGEQQRVAIARSLVNDPSMVLCDEVTGNLDSKTGDEIMSLLRKLNKEQGTTFILITHDPAVGSLTDRIVELKDGKVIGEKSMREVN